MDISVLLKDLLMMVVVLGVLVGIKIGLNYIKIKLGNSKYSEALDIVLDVVDEISQTYVQHLKETNSFDKEHQEEALMMALTKAHSLMSDSLNKYIEHNYGNVDTWLVTKIESYLWRSDPAVIEDNIKSIDSDDQVKLFE
jgi:hypothetical protein